MRGKISDPTIQELHYLNTHLAALTNPQAHVFIGPGSGNLTIDDIKLMITEILAGRKAEDN